MATRGRCTGMVGYNAHTAVDAKHHLIVEHEVTNVGHDRTLLYRMVEQAKAAIGSDTLDVVADRGYFPGKEIRACDTAQMTTHLPKPQTTGSLAHARFGKSDLIYKPDEDEYECPAGQRLVYRFTRQEHGQVIQCYWASGCLRCAVKSQCTTGDYRRVSHWEHEAVVEAAQRRSDKQPERMRVRRSTVEHPFGTLKSWMGHTHFLTKALPCVSTEMSLHVLAYNLKHVIAILGSEPLMKAMRA